MKRAPSFRIVDECVPLQVPSLLGLRDHGREGVLRAHLVAAPNVGEGLRGDVRVAHVRAVVRRVPEVREESPSLREGHLRASGVV